MAFDSLTRAAALALFAAGIGGWLLAAPLKARARLYLRFAAMLFAALAAATLLKLGDAAALLLLPLAAAALAIAALARFARPLNTVTASVLLVAGLAGGLSAILSGLAIPALMPVMVLGLAIIAAALNRVAIVAALSGASLLAAGLCFVGQGASAGMLLFAAAALIGLARSSTLAVEQQAHSWRLDAKGARQAAAIRRFQRDAVFAALGHGLPQDLRDK